MDLIFEQKELALSRYGMKLPCDLWLFLAIRFSGPYWRNMRRAAHRILGKEASLNHLPIQHAEATLLMHDLLVDPKVRR